MNLWSLSALAMAMAGVAQAQVRFDADEILVKVLPNNEAAFAAAKIAMGATELERYPQIGWVRLRLAAAAATPDGVVRSFRRMNFVRGAERVAIRNYFFDPNDPLIDQQWVVNRIQLPEAWDLTQGDPLVKIAVLDSGFEMTHPDLASQLLPGFDAVDGDNDPSDDANIGHGTHVAGIAAGATDNGVGIAGVGFNAKILPVRVGDFGIATADLVEGILWATNNGANVINMSLGGPFSSNAERDAVNFALQNNVFVVAAAGNNGTTQKSYPAAYPGVMAVASSDPDDSRSDFSQFGNWVHVAAPGSQILSTVMGGGYEAWDGTSMACPVVAGVAGLVFSRGGPSMTNDRVFEIITDTVDPTNGNYVIFGRVNAFEAVNATRVIDTADIEPISASTFVGSNGTGTLLDILNEDDSAMTLDGANVARFGKAAGIEAIFEMPGDPADFFNFQVKIRAAATRSITGMVWAWNVNSERWDFIKAFPVKTSESTNTFEVRNLDRYLDGSNQMKLRIRGHVPHRNAAAASPFTFSMDVVGMTADFEVQP